MLASPTMVLAQDTPAPAPAETPAASEAAPTAPAAITPPPAAAANARPTITPDEKKQVAKARTDALKNNPSLVAEDKEIKDKQKDLQKKVDAAAAASDPAIAAILAKMEAAHPTPMAKPDAKKDKTAGKDKTAAKDKTATKDQTAKDKTAKDKTTKDKTAKKAAKDATTGTTTPPVTN